MGKLDVVKDTGAKAASRLHNVVFRRSGGRIGSRFRKAPTMLLTTTGRKTGKQHTVPVLYLVDGDALVVVGSYGGDDRTPAWFLNLLANPDVTVERGAEKVAMTATLATPEERARLWPLLVGMYKSYEAYQKRTTRELPVAILRAK
jgi:deazaflavin-dependent oxidoreductase (nitroreductase family)